MSKIDPFVDIDEIDHKLIELMVSSPSIKNNKQISTILVISISTVRRRLRNLAEKGVMVSKLHVDYEKIGYRTGFIHVFKMKGNSNETVKTISKLKGVTSIENHIGDSHIIVSVVYRLSSDLSDIIDSITQMDNVQGITWSERIPNSPPNMDTLNPRLGT